MSNDEFQMYRGAEFMESRIPALDALSLFLPGARELPESAKQQVAEKGVSRWYPANGGHRVLVPYEG